MQAQEQAAVFHCPHAGCPYHRDALAAKSFKKQLFADQHVANKHQEKQFLCSLCGKRYAFAWQLKHHREVCGKIWSCLSCDKTYSERLSLVVHCKRHEHCLPEEARGWSHRKKGKHGAPVGILLLPILVPIAVPPAQGQVQTHDRVILPKVPIIDPSNGQSVATQTQVTETCTPKEQLDRKRKSEKQTGTQTEKKKRSASAQCPPIRCRPSNRRKGHRVTESTETQTLESILSSAGVTNHLSIRGSSNTRTTSTNVGPARRSISDLPTIQTGPCSGPEFGDPLVAETSVQTDDNRSILIQCSTIETQTCSSGLTQYYDDLDPEDFFMELDVNDIETQTIWNNDETTQTDGVLDDMILGFDLLSDTDPD